MKKFVLIISFVSIFVVGKSQISPPDLRSYSVDTVLSIINDTVQQVKDFYDREIFLLRDSIGVLNQEIETKQSIIEALLSLHFVSHTDSVNLMVINPDLYGINLYMKDTVLDYRVITKDGLLIQLNIDQDNLDFYIYNNFVFTDTITNGTFYNDTIIKKVYDQHFDLNKIIK